MHISPRQTERPGDIVQIEIGIAEASRDLRQDRLQPGRLHTTLRHDVSSLSDYDGHLLNKVQLLLDATLGFINVDQNNIIKVLTIVTVVGVPPTLIASMYGMNFHNMPEYDWAWGYPYALTLIFLSTVLPLIWFKMRGWF